MAFALRFPTVIICLFKLVIIYLNVYTKLEDIVWKSMRLFSWRDKIWFFLLQVEVFDLLFVLG